MCQQDIDPKMKSSSSTDSSVYYGVLFGSLSIFFSMLGASLTFPYLQGEIRKVSVKIIINNTYIQIYNLYT